MYYWHQTCSFTTSFTLCPSSCSDKTLYATSFSCATNTTNTRWSFFQCMTGSGTHLADFSGGGIQGLVHGVIGLEPALHYEAHLSPSRAQNHVKLFDLTIRFWCMNSGELLKLLNNRRPFWFDCREPNTELHPRNVNLHLTEELRCGKEILFSGATSRSSE